LIELIRLYVFDNITVSNPQPNYFHKNKKILYWRRQGDIQWETSNSAPSQLVLFSIYQSGRILSNFHLLSATRHRSIQVCRIIEALFNTGYVYQDEPWYRENLLKVYSAFPGIQARVFYVDGIPNPIAIPDLADLIEPVLNTTRFAQRRRLLLRINIRFGPGDTQHYLPNTSIRYAIEHEHYSRYARQRPSLNHLTLFFGIHPSTTLILNYNIPDRRAHHPQPGSTIQLPTTRRPNLVSPLPSPPPSPPPPPPSPPPRPVTPPSPDLIRPDNAIPPELDNMDEFIEGPITTEVLDEILTQPPEPIDVDVPGFIGEILDEPEDIDFEPTITAPGRPQRDLPDLESPPSPKRLRPEEILLDDTIFNDQVQDLLSTQRSIPDTLADIIPSQRQQERQQERQEDRRRQREQEREQARQANATRIHNLFLQARSQIQARNQPQVITQPPSTLAQDIDEIQDVISEEGDLISEVDTTTTTDDTTQEEDDDSDGEDPMQRNAQINQQQAMSRTQVTFNTFQRAYQVLHGHSPPHSPNNLQEAIRLAQDPNISSEEIINIFQTILAIQFGRAILPTNFALDIHQLNNAQLRVAIQSFSFAAYTFLSEADPSEPFWEWLNRFLNHLQVFPRGVIYNGQTMEDLLIGDANNPPLLNQLQNLTPAQLQNLINVLQSVHFDTSDTGIAGLRGAVYLITRIRQYLQSLGIQPPPPQVTLPTATTAAVPAAFAGINPLNFAFPQEFGHNFGFPYVNAHTNHLINLIIQSGEHWAVNLHRSNGTICTVPLTGSRSQLAELIYLLQHPNASQLIEWHCVSDDEQIAPIDIDTVEIWRVERPRTIRAVIGFFPYAHTTKFDLTRYQIYHVDNRPDTYNESCLMYALKQSGMFSQAQLNGLMLRLPKGCDMSKTDLKKVADYLQCKIHVNNIYVNKSTNQLQFKSNTVYGKEYESVVIKLGCLLNHVFLNELTQYFRFGVKHYHEVRDMPNWLKICRVKTGHFRKRAGFLEGQQIYRTSKKAIPSKQISSVNLIMELYNGGYFQAVPLSLKHPSMNEIASLDNVEGDQTEFEYKHKVRDPKTRFFYCDLECDTVSSNYHRPIIAGVSYRGWRGQEIFKQWCGLQCVQQMLIHIINECKRYGEQYKPILGFHNMLYDFSSAASSLQEVIGAVIKNGKMYSVNVLQFSVKTQWIDTYKLVSEPLRKFNKMFDLDVGKKELLPYSFYTIDNVNESGHYWVNLNDFANEFNKPENGAIGSSTFIDHVMGDAEILHKFVRGNEFDALGYYCWYNKYDCITLRKGMEKFNKQIRDFCVITAQVPLSPLDFLSISSFANHYFAMRGSYEGVWEISGGLRNYVQKAVYGGRAVGNQELMKKVIDSDWIEDLDFTSLYPYATYLLANQDGFPVGKCERILPGENVWNYKWFIVTIRINSIGKFQQIPMVQRRDEKNKMRWYNMGDETTGEFVVGKIALTDWIKFCHVDYTILDGVAWKTPEDGNRKGAEVIRQLFDLRQEYKRAGNNTQICIKLTLNSIYGKTCEKRSTRLTTVKSKEKAVKAICNRFGLFKKAYYFGNGKHAVIDFDNYDDSRVKNHIGVFILEMSKSIVNKVLDIATNNEITMIYTDTDSLHMFQKDIEFVAAKYMELYNTSLVGNDLGQMHGDFDDLPCKHGQVLSRRFLMLAPKVYVDEVVCTRCEMKTIHNRMKGIPGYSINTIARQDYNGDVFQMYIDLAQGKTIKFNINPPDHIKFDMKIGKVRTVLPDTAFRTIAV